MMDFISYVEHHANMPLSKEHKAETRARIIGAAAPLFRQYGFHGVGIDKLMAAAGLTRGGFYAHFSSKTALFAEVVRSEHPLVTHLVERDGRDAVSLWRQMHDIFAQYLAQENLDTVVAGCTLTALTADAGKVDDPDLAAAWEDGFAAIVGELARGQPEGPERPEWSSAYLLTVGSLLAAKAAQSEGLRRQILDGALAQFRAILAPLAPPGA